MAFKTLAGNTVDGILVGCVAEKQSLRPLQCVPLRELYTSDLWAKRRAYAEHHEGQGCPWMIVSAFHGVRLPDYESSAYDRQVKDYGSRKERESCGRMWANGFRTFLPDAPTGRSLVIEVHAGADYRDVLEGPLRDQGIMLVNPIEGLGIGQQKKWYIERLNGQLTLL